MFQILNSAIRTGAAATLVSAALLATPAIAQTAPQHETSGATTAPHSRVDRVEGRIKSFHDKLHITAAQSGQWDALAQVMRDNAKAMDALMTNKSQKPRATRTAVEELHVHQDMAQAHVDGLKAFTPAFEALYASMSDAQKKTADALFQRRDRHSSRHTKHTHT